MYGRPMPHRRAPRSQRFWALAAVTAIIVLAAPAGAQAFDTGPHTDITRDALAAEGFGATATDVVVVNNWFVDLYENDENWPQAVLDAANRMHFDASIWDVANVAKAQAEWDRLQRSATQLLRSIKSAGGANKELQLLATIGIGLHSLQDFYSHSTWIEQPGVKGVDGPDWSNWHSGARRRGSTCQRRPATR